MRNATGYASGRINLIGEHTDYNDGLVLPIALRLGVTAHVSGRTDSLVRASTDAGLTPREVTYELGGERGDGTWADRIRGITAALRERGAALTGLDLEITSTHPTGAGLGSSAAFAVAVLRALRVLLDLALDDDAMVALAHEVENGPYVGARSGLLDQLASVHGHERDALFIDLCDRSTDVIPLPSDVEFAVIDSGTRHEHATGGYNRRRTECEMAAQHLGVASLRELDQLPLDTILERLPAPLDRRVRHVLTENERVREAVAALRARDIVRLGALLDASHRSLRDDYEVSTPELDRLVALARAEPDVIGARLVGGGFGGSILALTRRGRAAGVAEKIVSRFRGALLIAVVP